jgi:NAD(P)-dependent dehydrogenase (short-subunit alcohol dehydrogenase family)
MPDHGETIAIIAGGTLGLGLAIAERPVVDGCTKLATAGRRKAEGETTAMGLRQRGAEVVFVPADIGRVEDAVALLAQAADRFGRVTGASGVMFGALVDFDHNAAGAYPE